jgi:hypothetical protein
VEELLVDTLAAVLVDLENLGQVEDGPGSGPFNSVCIVYRPPASRHVERLWASRGVVPDELREFWELADGARLFEDPDYGQWGLVLLSAAASSQRTESEFAARPDDLERDDIVIGEFLGDQDLLVYSVGEGVLVALPLDEREGWYRAAPSLTGFLRRYAESRGEKFWENNC